MSKEKTLGVEDFAKLAGVEVASARVILRNQKVKKSGKTYEFKSKTEMQSILDKREKAAPKKEEKKKAKKVVKKKSAKE